MRISTAPALTGQTQALQPPVRADGVTAAAFIEDPRLAAQVNSPVRRLALYCALVFIFVRFSFLHEIIGVTTGVRSFLPPLFAVPAIFGMVFSGGLGRAFRYRTCLYWIVFIGWLILATLFSTWPGGSFQTMSSYLQTQLPILFIIAGLVITWSEFKWVMYSIVLAGVVNELTARYMSNDVGGRLNLEIVTIGNANDFAAQLLLILPIFWFVSATPYIPRLIRFSMFPLIVFGLFLALRTGSRGAVIGMAVTYVFLTIRSKGVLRLVLAISGPVTAALLFAMLPSILVERYSTLYTTTPQSEEAAESAQGRTYLLRRSVDLTLHNPLLGIGPGEFSNAEGAEGRKRGERRMSMETHNSYTQISSEAGVPALIFLVAGIISAYRHGSKVRREARARGNPSIERAAFAVMLSFVLFCSCAFFLSLSYRFYFPVLTGLALALSTVARYEFGSSSPMATAGSGL